MTTFTANTGPVTLTTARYTSPVTIDAGVTISGGYYDGLRTTLYEAVNWSVDNNGTILASGQRNNVYGIGIYLNNDATHPTGGGTVTNASGALISGGAGGVLLVAYQTPSALYNAGTIENSGTQFSAVHLDGGIVSNAAYGLIAGATDGVDIIGVTVTPQGVNPQKSYALPETVLNAGTIAAANDGVQLFYGGLVSNAATGRITGVTDGALLEGNYRITNSNDTTVVNAGYIVGSHNVGVYLAFGGYASNAAHGTIIGGRGGVYMLAGGTLRNAGTITGTLGTAVYFRGSVADRVIVDPGAVFNGTIHGSTTSGATNTIELTAGTGTLTGFGVSVTNFANVALDTGANWLVAGSATGLNGETISGFGAGSTVELTGAVEGYAALTGGALTLSGGTRLDLPGLPAATVTNDGVNTFITACFASGTRIATARGPVPVEALRPGDAVLSAAGRLAPIRWLGVRRTDLARHPRPWDVQPVRVHASAFGEGVPCRDLVLSPDHAVFMDGHLVPIRHLINGVSIVQETRASVTYWHVELDRHDLVLAEGLACESYLDTGNRTAFENAPGAVALTPDFARPDFARATWAAAGCAPILTDPQDARLRALHTRLLARARRGAAVPARTQDVERRRTTG